jgi:hypothetical protein
MKLLALFLFLMNNVDVMQMWESLVQKAKDGGLDAVDTYVFWNVHEPSPGNVLSFTHSLHISSFSVIFITLTVIIYKLMSYEFFLLLL